MTGGKLIEKITFVKEILTKDGAGGFSSATPTILLETYASIKQNRATRGAENLQEAINATYEIKLRKRALFKPYSNYIVQWQGDDYVILTIEETLEPKNEWILIIAKRGTSL